ncbi:hypothetical protein QJQ45_022327 [Haematococcus lacustris]|nr:hypothetical protein QJQ45_022327 [Haematococcus lacustris]
MSLVLAQAKGHSDQRAKGTPNTFSTAWARSPATTLASPWPAARARPQLRCCCSSLLQGGVRHNTFTRAPDCTACPVNAIGSFLWYKYCNAPWDLPLPDSKHNPGAPSWSAEAFFCVDKATRMEGASMETVAALFKSLTAQSGCDSISGMIELAFCKGAAFNLSLPWADPASTRTVGKWRPDGRLTCRKLPTPAPFLLPQCGWPVIDNNPQQGYFSERFLIQVPQLTLHGLYPFLAGLQAAADKPGNAGKAGRSVFYSGHCVAAAIPLFGEAVIQDFVHQAALDALAGRLQERLNSQLTPLERHVWGLPHVQQLVVQHANNLNGKAFESQRPRSVKELLGELSATVHWWKAAVAHASQIMQASLAAALAAPAQPLAMQASPAATLAAPAQPLAMQASPAATLAAPAQPLAMQASPAATLAAPAQPLAMQASPAATLAAPAQPLAMQASPAATLAAPAQPLAMQASPAATLAAPTHPHTQLGLPFPAAAKPMKGGHGDWLKTVSGFEDMKYVWEVGWPGVRPPLMVLEAQSGRPHRCNDKNYSCQLESFKDCVFTLKVVEEVEGLTARDLQVLADQDFKAAAAQAQGPNKTRLHRRWSGHRKWLQHTYPQHFLAGREMKKQPSMTAAEAMAMMDRPVENVPSPLRLLKRGREEQGIHSPRAYQGQAYKQVVGEVQEGVLVKLAAALALPVDPAKRGQQGKCGYALFGALKRAGMEALHPGVEAAQITKLLASAWALEGGAIQAVYNLYAAITNRLEGRNKGTAQGKGKVAKAKAVPQPGRWLDRDCNAALNMQRIGESRWRPLELCYWPEQGALPAKGKETTSGHPLGPRRNDIDKARQHDTIGKYNSASQWQSTPNQAKRSKRTKAEQAAEPTQPTKGKGKAQGKAVKGKPAPQPGRWLDRDCNAALNMQRIEESRWRPLELCWWPKQGKLPAKGKEYPGLGCKRLRDKPPKAQQQQPAVAQ